MAIRLLPPVLVNRIAAGEVVERPAAAVKELVENAIDAGADRIEVTLREGGQALIAVADDGSGMNADEVVARGRAPLHLETARRRSVARSRRSAFAARRCRRSARSAGLRIVSRPPAAENRPGRSASRAARKHAPIPAAAAPGTRVEVRDLFFATPARLKFLKTPRTERDQAVDVVQRLAMAYPAIAFTVTGDDERSAAAPAAAARARSAPRAARRAARPRFRREFAGDRRRARRVSR